MSFWDQVVVNPRFWLSAGALVSVTAVLCLLANWAASGPRVKLERVLLSWLAIMALLPVRAEVPALFFTLVAAVTMLLVRSARHLSRERAAGESRRTGWQRFSLTDLMVLTLFVGTLLGLTLRVPNGHLAVAGCAMLALWISLVASLSYHVATSKRRTSLLVLLAAALVALSGLGRAAWGLPHFRGLEGERYDGSELSLHELFLGLLILMGYFAMVLGQATWKGGHSPSRSLRAAWIAFVVSATLFGLFIWYMHGTMRWGLEDEWRRTQQMLASALPLSLLAISILAVAGLARWYGSLAPGTVRRAATAGLSLAALALALPMGWLYWQMLWPLPLPPIPSDAPTNYHRLVAIARELRDTQRHPSGRLRLSAADEKLVAEASLLLAAPNYMPVEALEQETRRPLPDATFRHHDAFAVVRAFDSAALAAQGLREYDRGADRGIDLLRFGTMLQRGGTSGHTQMGWTMHRSACHLFRLLSGKMSPEKCREVIRALDDALAQREDPAVQAVRDLAFNDRTGRWEGRFRSVIAKVVPTPLPTTAPADDLSIHIELAIRSVQLELALDQYRKHSSQRRIASLADLVPDYLPAVPRDPYSQGQLLLLRTMNNELIPYSVGYDGIDNGGKFAPNLTTYYSQPGYDLKLPVP